MTKSLSRFAFAAGLVAFGGELAAQSVNCNIAPNTAFEQGSAAIDQWAFAALSGSATFAVSNHPSPVQSGARAAKIIVQQPGDIFLATVEPGQIPVLASTSYLLSVQVKGDSGKVAGIRVIEWNGSTATADRFLGYSTGSGNWETVENTFTTTSTTNAVSIRLMHHIHSGTFYWDDVLLARHCAEDRCVDIRHYVAQTKPGFKMCIDASGSFCLDGVKTPGKEYLEGNSNGDRGYISHTLAGRAMTGTQKAIDAQFGVRCFANPGEACGAARSSPGQNAQFPPGMFALSFRLPVADLTLGTDEVTAGAARLFDWQPFDVREFNTTTGQSGAQIGGSIFHRAHAFILPSRNFGGSLGNQSHVIVVEGESGMLCSAGFEGGARLERYMLARGFGVVYSEGRDDIDCRNAPSISTCNGLYSTVFPPTANFIYVVNGDMAISNDAPQSFNAVDWW